MDALTRYLVADRIIPLEKAASFFVDLHSWQRMSGEDDELYAQCIKQAGEEAEDAVLPSPATSDVEGLQEFLAREQEGQAAEEQNSVEYYRQLLEQMRSELSATQQQQSETSQQLEELTAQQQAHEQQMASAQQEGQLAQQAALQQVQSANAAASTALQQAVDAENRALQAKGMEATAKIQQQQVRSQLFDLAAQGLPGSEPPVEEGGAPLDPAAAAVQEAPVEGAEAPATDLNQQGEPLSGDGMPGQQAPAQGGASTPPTELQSPGGEATSGPQANATGESGNVNGNPTAHPVSIKVGEQQPASPAEVIRTRLERLRARQVPPEPKLAAPFSALMRDPRVMGGAIGGVTGASLAALEATGHGPNLDKLRAKIQQGEQRMREPGLRGFSQAFDLAQQKVLLTMGEATQAHPVAATLTGGAMGAMMGSETPAAVAALIREAKALHSR